VRETVNLIDIFLGLVLAGCAIASMAMMKSADRQSAD
jgi:hypothetical protein